MDILNYRDTLPIIHNIERKHAANKTSHAIVLPTLFNEV